MKNIPLIGYSDKLSLRPGETVSFKVSSTLKKTNLELGGKNSAIICKTSNLDFAVSKVINAIFENGGQACVAISRVIIDENIFDNFIKKIKIKIKKMYSLKKLKIQIPATENQKRKISSTIKYIRSNYSQNLIEVFNMGSKKFTPIFVNCKNFKRWIFGFSIRRF